MSDEVQSLHEGAVLTLSLNRVEKKNALTAAMYQTLADAVSAAQNNDAVRVLVIQAHEAVFCAGNDIADFLNQPPAAQDAPVFQFLRALSGFTKPIVASVCGPAVGIGTTMLLHCDLVVAGDNAAFSMPFVNLGLCPEAASSYLVPQLMGYHRAAEALLLGEPFMAEAALEVGFVNRIVPPGQANALAQQLAKKLASKPLRSLLETKRLLKKSSAAQVAERLNEEAEVFAHMLREDAAREAFSAFMARRLPDFSKC
jgi:enoyl-CoA hydratase/carnithine racemase